MTLQIFIRIFQILDIDFNQASQNDIGGQEGNKENQRTMQSEMENEERNIG